MNGENDMKTSIETRSDYRRRWFLTAGIALALAAFGVEARSLAEIQKTKELRVCIAFVSPAMGKGKAEPAGCRDNCRSVTGDTPEFVAAFARSLGNDVKPKWVSVNCDEQYCGQGRQGAQRRHLYTRLACLLSMRLLRNGFR